MKPWTKYTGCHFINFAQRLFYVLRRLIIGPGPCNFKILKYRLFLESVCVGKQELGFVSDPFSKGHEIPPLPPYIQPLGHRLDFGFCLD